MKGLVLRLRPSRSLRLAQAIGLAALTTGVACRDGAIGNQGLPLSGQPADVLAEICALQPTPIPPLRRPGPAPQPPTCWAQPSDLDSVTSNGSNLRAVLFPGPPASATVDLPSMSSGAMRLTDTTGLSVQVQLEGASPSSLAAVGGGFVVYRGALDASIDILQRVTRRGTEDFFYLPLGSSRSSLDYQVTPGPGIAGLRVVGDTVEFMSSAGAPRFRVHQPTLLGADGSVTRGQIRVARWTRTRRRPGDERRSRRALPAALFTSPGTRPKSCCRPFSTPHGRPLRQQVAVQ